MQGTTPLITQNTQLQEQEQEDNCSICLASFAGREVIVMTTKCGHKFDEDCLLPWLNESETCPICRTNISERAITPQQNPTIQLNTRPQTAMRSPIISTQGLVNGYVGGVAGSGYRDRPISNIVAMPNRIITSGHYANVGGVAGPGGGLFPRPHQ